MLNFGVKENTLYKDVNTAEFYIEIENGNFVGVCFTFGQIEFVGEDEEGNGKINFDYHLLYVPENINLEEQKKDLESDIGKILEIVLRQMVDNTQNDEEVNETGNSDSEQLID